MSQAQALSLQPWRLDPGLGLSVYSNSAQMRSSLSEAHYPVHEVVSTVVVCLFSLPQSSVTCTP